MKVCALVPAYNEARTIATVVQGAAAPLSFPDRRRGAPDEIRQQFGFRAPAPGYAAHELALRAAAERSAMFCAWVESCGRTRWAAARLSASPLRAAIMYHL